VDDVDELELLLLCVDDTLVVVVADDDDDNDDGVEVVDDGDVISVGVEGVEVESFDQFDADDVLLPVNGNDDKNDDGDTVLSVVVVAAADNDNDNVDRLLLGDGVAGNIDDVGVGTLVVEENDNGDNGEIVVVSDGFVVVVFVVVVDWEDDLVAKAAEVDKGGKELEERVVGVVFRDEIDKGFDNDDDDDGGGGGGGSGDDVGDLVSKKCDDGVGLEENV